MSSVSLYNITIPVFIRGLNNLSAILKKGQAFADEKGLPYAKLLEARLVDDMAALPFQIQRVSDTAKAVPVRVAGVEGVSMEDNETTFEELEARIQRTIDFLKAVDPKSMDGKEDSEVIIKRPSGDITTNGTNYILMYALPNFFFHVTAAYAILRHMGVPVGKGDYLGRHQ